MDENKTIKTSITQKDIQNEAVKLANTPTDGTCGLFAVHTANGWIDAVKNKPQPRMLFSEFWHEGELCILFADTNLGKSILAVQMGDSISRGQPIPGFALQTRRKRCCTLILNYRESSLKYAICTPPKATTNSVTVFTVLRLTPMLICPLVSPITKRFCTNLSSRPYCTQVRK